MLQAVLEKDTNEILIRGEFFELDEIYFMIKRITGDYGISKNPPLPEYQNALFMLLALTHEIRYAENGNRELYCMYNGIREEYVAPAGTPAEQIIKPEPFLMLPAKRNSLFMSTESISWHLSAKETFIRQGGISTSLPPGSEVSEFYSTF